MTTKHVCMRAVSARPYLGCLRLGSQETSESAKSLDQPHDQSPFFFALVRLHAINVSVVVARAPAGTPETKEIMMVHVLSIILLSDRHANMHIMHAHTYAYYACL